MTAHLRRSPNIACSWSGPSPPFTSENGVDFFEGLNVKRHRFRLKNTGVGPMTPRALCCDDISGEIYE
jgi:hypothetical protein